MDALSSSKRQKCGLGHLLYPIDCFAFGLWSLVFFEQVDVLLRVENVGETPAPKARVCSSSHSKIREILPVGQVMTALVPWQCPVRYFVVLVTFSLQTFVGILIHIDAEVFICGGDSSFICPGVEWCAFLNNQRVERKVFRLQGQRMVERFLPVAYR